MVGNVQRSLLIMPAHVQRFVEKAAYRGADAIVLDLEDAVPPAEKERARDLLATSVRVAGMGGADVLVRVNNEPFLLEKDVKAAIQPGLHAIFLPKVVSGDDVRRVEALIESYERTSGIDAGTVRISIHIESPIGVLRLEEIATAGTRIESMSIGVDDYRLELGAEPSNEAAELLMPFSMLALVCRSVGASPIGIMGSVADFSDLMAFERAALRSRGLGFSGAFCIHPDQVSVLNRVFTPSASRIDHAKRIVQAFEEGLTAGRASVNLEGRMVDTPIYKQALRILEIAEAVAERERRKTCLRVNSA